MPYTDIAKRREMQRRRYALRIDRTLPPCQPAPSSGLVHGEPVWMPALGRMGLRTPDGLFDVGFGTAEILPDRQGRPI